MREVICESCQERQVVHTQPAPTCESCGSAVLTSVEGYREGRPVN